MSKKYYFIIIILFQSLFLCSFINICFSESFPNPKLLKGSVNFWKKIYTTISENEGVFHDRIYPNIIYKKIYIGDKKGKFLNEFLKKSKIEIYYMLKRIKSSPEDTLSLKELNILDQFEKFSSKDEITINHVRFQKGQKEQFKAGIQRSGMFISKIKSIFKEYNIPERLVYLPCVESSFNQNAKSKAGAIGLWQFMKMTGKGYLTITKEIDERYDPILSTRAAAKLLNRNYKELKSWPLAITAYNHGLSGMKRAVKIVGTNDIGEIIEKYKGSSFKFASKNFYSSFLAASEVAMDYKKYFCNVHMEQPIYRTRINLKNINYNDACETLGIPLKTFKKYNPALRPIFYKTKKIVPKIYSIYIPNSIAVFDDELSANLVQKHELIENEISWYD